MFDQINSIYLRPLWIQLLGPAGIFQGFGELPHLDVGRGSVAVQYVVGWVQPDGLRVEPDRRGEVAGLTRRVGLPHLFQEERLVVFCGGGRGRMLLRRTRRGRKHDASRRGGRQARGRRGGRGGCHRGRGGAGS